MSQTERNVASKPPRRSAKSVETVAAAPSDAVEHGVAVMDHAAQTMAGSTQQLAAATFEAGDRAIDQAEAAAAPAVEAIEPVVEASPEPIPPAAIIDDVVTSVAVATPNFAISLPAVAGLDADALGVTTATEKAKKMIEDMNDRAKTALEKGSKLFEDINEFGKGNVEAFVESSKIAAKGFEALGQEAADYSRRSVESMTSAFKGFASVKSPTELFKLQSDYAKAAFDAMVAESSKTTEMVLKIAGDVAQPLSSRVAVAAEKVKLAA